MVKRCSEDKEFTTSTIKEISFNYAVLQYMYVACIYEMKWWIGTKTRMMYVKINFIRPHGPGWSFHWPHMYIC